MSAARTHIGPQTAEDTCRCVGVLQPGVAPVHGTKPAANRDKKGRRPAPPRLTAELFSIPVDGAWLVYAPLRRAAFLANASVVDRIADLQRECADLADAQTRNLVDFLRGLEIIDGGEEHLPVTACSGPPRPTAVTLFLTTSCNLRCTYCYASAGDTPRKMMPLEVARRGIDFVVDNACALGSGSVEINYHGGGEPTMNWPTLTGSYACVRERADAAGLQVRAAIATNGVLPDEKIDWIVEHLDSASVSCDGTPDVHDVHRRTVGGKGSADRLEHTLRRFEAAGLDFGLRLTVTHDAIGTLERSITYLLSRFKPHRIQVEPAYLLGRWKDRPSAETEAFLADFRAAQAAAASSGHSIEFSGARLGVLSNHFCAVSQDSFGLTADGEVSACYEVFMAGLPWSERFLYGGYQADRKTFEFNLAGMNHLRQRTVDRQAFCQGCFAKWSCGGDCYYKSLAIQGDGEFAGTDRCHIIRELTKDQLLRRIESSGGLFWHEPPCGRCEEEAVSHTH